MSIESMIKNSDTAIIDVRSRAEFMGGNVAGSINIPLQEIEQRMDELKAVKGQIILCCASGNRSGMATQILRQKGFDNVYNGGSWFDVNHVRNN